MPVSFEVEDINKPIDYKDIGTDRWFDLLIQDVQVSKETAP